MSQEKFPLRRFLATDLDRLSNGLRKAVDDEIVRQKEVEKQIGKGNAVIRQTKQVVEPLYVPPQFPEQSE